MGTRTTWICLMLGMAGWLHGTEAFGQARVYRAQTGAYRPETGPAVSPYINLARRGTPGGVNYYGLVRPQITVRNQLGTLRQEVENLQEQVTEQVTTGTIPPVTTGHPVQFQNYSRYFPAVPGSTGTPRTITSAAITPRITPTVSPPPRRGVR